MSTRYSLPTHVPQRETDTARSARTLATAVLVVAVIALTLLAAMVPVAECSWPTITSVSVTASFVVLTCAVGYFAAIESPGMPMSGRAARPMLNWRRDSD